MTMAGSNVCNIMLSASGRRVALMRLLQCSLRELALGGDVLATDITATAPAMHLASAHSIVPPYRDPGCLPALLALVQEHRLSLIVPTIDPELGFYAAHREDFAQVGCAINVSSATVIEIGSDKVATHQWLTSHDLPTVQQWSLADALKCATLPFPVVVKPRFGSASIGISIARNTHDLEARATDGGDLVVQSRAEGQEYTVDVFVDKGGRCLCAVPRLRLEVRAGEVSKGVTVKNKAISRLACTMAESLPGAYGVMNIQLFHDPKSGRMQIIELNPRFGGGYPLSHEAGAPMAKWLIEDVLGMPSSARNDVWREGVVMLRYDDAVFVNAKQAGVELPDSRGLA